MSGWRTKKKKPSRVCVVEEICRYIISGHITSRVDTIMHCIYSRGEFLLSDRRTSTGAQFGRPMECFVSSGNAWPNPNIEIIDLAMEAHKVIDSQPPMSRGDNLQLQEQHILDNPPMSYEKKAQSIDKFNIRVDIDMG